MFEVADTNNLAFNSHLHPRDQYVMAAAIVNISNYAKSW